MQQKKLIFTLISGMVALLVAMGIGRFAYTPLLPYMQQSQGFSETMAGYLASSNYLGYLLGAVLTGAVRWRNKRTLFFQMGLLANILTTGLMGSTADEWLWLLWRFLSGISSAMVLVLASGIVLDQLAKYQRVTWAGLFYGGVGWGIFFSGLFVPYLVQWLEWDGAWFGLMIFSLLIGLPSFFGLRETNLPNQSLTVETSSEETPNADKKQLGWLMAAYGCEGLGYIITGTFLVAIAANIPTLAHNPTLSWIVAGLAAIPSCIIWAWIAKHWGYSITLILAYLLQAIGVLLPVLLTNAMGIYIGSFLFGGTFMGITTLVTSMGQKMYPQESSRVIGYLTAVYGIGQILGPLGAGILAEKTHSYASSLVGATGIILLGMAFIIVQALQHTRKNRRYPYGLASDEIN
ncbi:MAG: YbfB/YjiJ family MFS transporter [Firmicutes bacterium]|nr:YbfB/YjiJ family MFS transporter [Bacillota bacterium]